MMETVKGKEDLERLPATTVSNFVGYLCHETCECSGAVFELGGHWISRLGWQRTKGVRFPAGFEIEDVRQRFAEISDFTGAETPDGISSEAYSMAPPVSS